MPSTWSIANELDECGYDGVLIPVGAPMELVSRAGLTRTLKRCVDHRQTDVNWAEVDRARHDAELVAERQAIRDGSQPVSRALAKRVHPSKPLRSFSSMSDLASTFDPRLAQTGERNR